MQECIALLTRCKRLSRQGSSYLVLFHSPWAQLSSRSHHLSMICGCASLLQLDRPCRATRRKLLQGHSFGPDTNPPLPLRILFCLRLRPPPRLFLQLGSTARDSHNL